MRILKVLIFPILALMVIAIVIGFVQPNAGFVDSKLRLYESIKGNNLFKLVNTAKINGIKQYGLFSPAGKNAGSKAQSEFVSRGSFMTISSQQLALINSEKPKTISIAISGLNNEIVEFEMTMVNIISKDFKMLNSATGESHNINHRGLYYQGIIKGKNNSLAALSVFDNFVMGMAADESGNYVLGSIKDDNHNYTSNYVYYNDRDLLKHIPFNCGVGEKEDRFVVPNKNNSVHVPSGDNSELYKDTVGVFFDTDYQMYVDNNNNEANVFNFVSGFFNFVAMLYNNESIPFKISGVGYWQTTDPYASYNDSYAILQKFGENKKDNFMGDLAHLLSTGHNQQLGGIAWINVLCQPATQQQGTWVGRFAFSNIENNYLPYPTYSWTVAVVTHEMGHNLGSYHTHACHWDLSPIGGGLGPLDTCVVSSENLVSGGGCINANPTNNCYQPNNPAVSGFIMSYCHICASQGGGINFLNGFGRPFGTMWSQSGDTIRLRFQQAACIHSNLNASETPNGFMLAQNFPNPFNPATTIRFALPEDGFVTLKVYDVNGREVVTLLSSRFYSTGVYNQPFDPVGLNLASGVYLYRIDVSNNSKKLYSEIKKMVLVK